MNNKGLIITLIILLIIVIILLIAFLGLSINGKIGLQKWNAKKSKQVIFDNSYEMSQVGSLEILSAAGDIKFEESTDGKVRVVVYGENEEELQVSLNGNQLNVDFAQYRHRKFFLGFRFYSNDIMIYLPKDVAHEISVKANYGDIKAIDLPNSTMNIREDCGDVILGKMKNVFVKNSYGDIKIAEISNKVEIESDCGDVKIGSVNLMENSSIVNSLGDIKIGQTNEIYMDAKTELGEVKINHNDRHADIILKIQNSCGDIKVGN